MCLVNDNEQFDAVKQFVFLEVVIMMVMVMSMLTEMMVKIKVAMMFMLRLSMKVGVTADMGISIDGGEEYREGVLTITEVNPN